MLVKNRGNDNPKDLHGAAVSTRDERYPEAGCNSARRLGGRGDDGQSERGPRREKLWVHQSHRDGDHGN